MSQTPRPLLCPRTSDPLVAAPDAPSGPWECARCHGSFAPREALGRLHRALVHIERARDQVLASVGHGTGIRACPGCQSATVALVYFEVPIDWCAHCGGVWLDGGELERLTERVQALGGDLDAAQRPFRDAASPVVTGTVTCAACGARVAINKSYLTSRGTLCIACGMADNHEMPSARDAAEVDAFLDSFDEEKSPSERLADEFRDP